MKIKSFFGIIIAAVIVVATSIGTIYIVNYLAAHHKCRTRLSQIQRFEDILLAPHAEILKNTKKEIKDHIQELEYTISRVQDESLQTRLESKQATLEHEISDLQQELKKVESVSKLPQHKLLAKAKTQNKKVLSGLEKRIELQKNYIAQIRNKPDFIDPILEERAQQTLNHLEQKLKKSKERVALSDNDLLNYFQNKLQEQAIQLTKQIDEKEQLMQSPKILADTLAQEHQKRLKQLHKELIQEQEKLRMTDAQLIEYGKDIFEQKLIKQTIEAYQRGCKKD